MLSTSSVGSDNADIAGKGEGGMGGVDMPGQPGSCQPWLARTRFGGSEVIINADKLRDRVHARKIEVWTAVSYRPTRGHHLSVAA
jgi:hypothetical protein